MTPLEWFAFLILPAALAILAFSASRLFDFLHPIPATGSMSSTPQSFSAPPVAGPLGARESSTTSISQSSSEVPTELQNLAAVYQEVFGRSIDVRDFRFSNALDSNALQALEAAHTAYQRALKIQSELRVRAEEVPDPLPSPLKR